MHKPEIVPGRHHGCDDNMPTIALQAHFDGKRIILDEPYDLPPNASLIVTLLPAAAVGSSATDSEEAWLKATASSDAFQFLADPAEDIYSAQDGEPFQEAT
jgi:hypothetical protein